MKAFRLETDVETRACELIYKYLGIQNSKFKAIGGNGYPDRIFWVPGGIPFFIEFKKPGEEPAPKQEHIHKFLHSLGYPIQVYDNEFDAFEAVINFVDSPQVSKEGRKILTEARRRCTVLRSRAG